jgi:DNA-binding winged helix-turn-helix (wHTH) protein
VDERALPLGLIAQALRDALAREGLIDDEYFVTVPGRGAADFPTKADRIACYATRRRERGLSRSGRCADSRG